MVVTRSSAPGQGSVVPITIIAAVLGSILGLILVGGAVALILFFILRQSMSPSHKEIIAGIQGDLVCTNNIIMIRIILFVTFTFQLALMITR